MVGDDGDPDTHRTKVGLGMSDHREQWQPWLQRLAEEQTRARGMGGPERVARQHATGRLDVRQRVEQLFDPGSFREIGALVGNASDMPADGFVCGHGLIDGRLAFVGAEDFTLKAGSIGTGGTSKRHRIAELALQEGAPIVWINQGAGARLGPRTAGAARAPSDLEPMADCKGQVPVVCLVLGVSAGHGALSAPLADFVVMTRDAALFTGGPELVRAATGEDVTVHDLGGWRVHAEMSGTVHRVTESDEEAIALARAYLSYFPSNRSAGLPDWPGPDSSPRPTPELLDIIPPDARQPYDVRDVIHAIVDDHDFFELHPTYGRAITVGWAVLGGRVVGIVANNPAFQAGALDAAAAIKATEFIEMADTYGQPVIFLLDNPGVLAGTKAERDGVLKWGGRMYLAVRRLSTPKISVLMRKGFGFGLVTMAHMPHDRQTLLLALPSANVAAMPAQSGGRTAHLDDEARDRLEREQLSGPYGIADRLGVDDVVSPVDLRDRLIDGLSMAANRTGTHRTP